MLNKICTSTIIISSGCILRSPISQLKHVWSASHLDGRCPELGLSRPHRVGDPVSRPRVPLSRRGVWILAPRAALLSPHPPWIMAPALASGVTWANYLSSWCLGFPPGLQSGCRVFPAGQGVRPPAAQSCLLDQSEQLDSECPEARTALRPCLS